MSVCRKSLCTDRYLAGELSGYRQNVLEQYILGFLSSNSDSCQAETCSSSCGVGAGASWISSSI